MSESPLLVFISHSHKDADLAGAVTNLLQDSLGLIKAQIRCTSIDEHRLPAGASIVGQLRADLETAPVVIALTTPNSLLSHWFSVEVGLRWSTDQLLIPLLAGIEASELPSPLNSLNPLSANNEKHLQQLLKDISQALKSSVQELDSHKVISRVIDLADQWAKLSPQTPLYDYTVDAVGGLQTSRVFLKKGQKFLVEAEGRIHLASDQVDNFARALKPLIVKYTKGKVWDPEIERRYQPIEFVEATIFYRGWVGPEGELQRSDMLEDCKLRTDLNWGALLAVILPVKASSWADPLHVLKSNDVDVQELFVPQGKEQVASREGWLTFIVNDAVISPYSPSEDGQIFYHALKAAAQTASQIRHQVPQILPLPLAFYADNLGTFRVNVTVYPIKL